MAETPGESSVYPRGCGERAILTIKRGKMPGLSPRMRGTEIKRNKGELLCRFIPADAGNGTAANRSGRRISVYPRGCGERCAFIAGDGVQPGLSPRMRGTGRGRPGQPAPVRFIPADAGNGSVVEPTLQTAAVYPRG